ncbi:starch synthase [Pararhizobium capsulatum DSM 1112]|uniref:Glycogen synthase n=1 Tax=Pararhizobium capsulatum DSM 1112 TaxID=1121113 RepID=A0ABU0BWC0_9HYPH|nr:glycogen synthase GlgA [Pararhizobium capsulatum]MDQ0322556.1 starch synthase [Pararhizobium capsulatum DSM 1112]
MNILSVTSEIFPLIKTGGLADVTGSLPKVLKAHGCYTRSLVPGYPRVIERLDEISRVHFFPDLFGAPARLLAATGQGLDLLVLDAPTLYDRPGGPYVDEDGVDFPDNWKRFAVLSYVASAVAGGLLEDWIPDIVHTHDWQTALTSVYMRYSSNASHVPSVLTIHNLAFQGQFGADLINEIGLPPEALSVDCLEYYGDMSYLKGGIRTATAITTVSPTYAREVISTDLGMGMDGVLESRLNAFIGIVNGIDTEIWNPATDDYLPVKYDRTRTRQRTGNRQRLLEAFQLEDTRGPIFAAITRLTWQKGGDMLADVAEHIRHKGGKLVVLGKGDPGVETALLAAAGRHPGWIGVKVGYDEATAHLMHGGADVVIQPSRFEPCGLTQLYALRYGAVPLVSRTGGLSETIIDANDAAFSARVATGFQFHPATSENLRSAIDRAFHAYLDPKKWARLQGQAMKADFSWERSATQYAALYARLLPPAPRKQSPIIRAAE